jgi:hypothetical protein
VLISHTAAAVAVAHMAASAADASLAPSDLADLVDVLDAASAGEAEVSVTELESALVLRAQEDAGFARELTQWAGEIASKSTEIRSEGAEPTMAPTKDPDGMPVFQSDHQDDIAESDRATIPQGSVQQISKRPSHRSRRFGVLVGRLLNIVTLPETLAVLRSDKQTLEMECMRFIEDEINRSYLALGPPPGLEKSLPGGQFDDQRN